MPIISSGTGKKFPKIAVNPDYRWKTKSFENGVVHYSGDGISVAKTLSLISSSMTLKDFSDKVSDVLNLKTNMSAGIFVFGDWTIAWVDHIRSFPVFYSIDDDQIVSNDARLVLQDISDHREDEGSILEFCMAGFVTGRDTLYKNVKCLCPGEVIIFNASEAKTEIRRYYQYVPCPDEKASREINIHKLSSIIDEIIFRVIERANGRPIWVPLSAGLDSRLILCKLHEHGYKNLHTFTYGPKYNFEALHAKKVAKTLGVPWHFVGIDMIECRRIFQGQERVEYSRYADGLKSAPSMREYVALKILKEKGILSSDSILINGQSGDYITGGHVSPFWYEKSHATYDDLIRIILNKHYDLWHTLKTPENIEVIKNKIMSVLPDFQTKTALDFAALEEAWEFDARQITLVVNGQRSYDFFGFDWELPLWERDLCDFYQSVSYDQKREQSLFKEYLREYNYKDMFQKKEPKIWRWPLFMIWVVPFAKALELISGRNLKKKFYAYMRYFGHYSNQYAFFPLYIHQKTLSSARNIFSLYVRHWFIENSFSLPFFIKSAMRMDDNEK